MDVMMAGAVAKVQMSNRLQEAQTYRYQRAVGVTTWWEKAVEQVRIALSNFSKMQEKRVVCCADERALSCC